MSKLKNGSKKVLTPGDLAKLAGDFMELLVIKARREKTPPGGVVTDQFGKVTATLTPIKCGSKSLTAVLYVAVET